MKEKKFDKRTGIMVLIVALLGLGLVGCKAVKVSSARPLMGGQTITFAGNPPVGVALEVTVNPKDISYTPPAAEANAAWKMPDLSKLPEVKGWFLFNVTPE